MSHVRVTINGTQEMDENLGTWTASQPPEFLQRLKPPPGPHQSKPEMHMMAIGAAIAIAVLTGEDADINVTTGEDGWSMLVKKSFSMALPA